MSTNFGLFAMWWLTGAAASSYLKTNAVPHKLEAILTLLVTECLDYGLVVTFVVFSAIAYVSLLVIWFKIVAPFMRMCVRRGRATKAAGSAAKSAALAKGSAARTALATRTAELLTTKTTQQPTQPTQTLPVADDRLQSGAYTP